MGEVGGSRHYVSPLTGDPLPPWKCVACGQPNDSPLELGCQHCGSGKPGYKAPPEPPRKFDARARINPPLKLGQDPTAFEGWWTMHASELLDKTMKEIASLAWQAAGAHHGPSQPVQPETDPYDPEPSFSVDGVKARTFIAALELFRDQVLTQADDEIASGEWAPPRAVDEWIADLKADLGAL